jgi:NADH-quinone oxidoreductase subunit K
MTPAVSLEYPLILAAALFVLGLACVIARRNLIFMLLGLEIMLNAAGLAFVTAGAAWAQPEGQVMLIFLLAYAASEAAVALALILQIFSSRKTLDSDAGGRT